MAAEIRTTNVMDGSGTAYPIHCQVSSGINGTTNGSLSSLYGDLMNTTSTVSYADYHRRPMSISSTTQLIPTDLSPTYENRQCTDNTLNSYSCNSRAHSSDNLLQTNPEMTIAPRQTFDVSQPPAASIETNSPINRICTSNLSVGIATASNITTTQATRTDGQNAYRTIVDMPNTRLPAYSPPSRPPSQRPTSQRTHRHSSQHTSVHTQTSHIPHQQETCKEPCLKCLSAFTSFKCILMALSLVGVCCVVTGIALGALHAIAGSFLFLSIMFLALGAVLVIVVFIAWKCTPRGHQPCHMFLGLGEHGRHRRTHASRGRRRNRESNWYGGVLYPEFRHRRPPPSYTASMQDYHQRVMQAQQQYIDRTIPDTTPGSPPPTYRSHSSASHPTLQIAFSTTENQPNSRPPTYRSHIGPAGAHPRPVLPIYSGHANDNLPVVTHTAAPSTDAVTNECMDTNSLQLSGDSDRTAERATNSPPRAVQLTQGCIAQNVLEARTLECVDRSDTTRDTSRDTTRDRHASCYDTRDGDASPQSQTQHSDGRRNDECIETLLASAMRTFDEISMVNTEVSSHNCT